MQKSIPPDSDSAEVPPTVINLDLPSTETVEPAPELEWEKSQGPGALWHTSLEVCVNAVTFAGRIRAGNWRTALAFAVCSELLAISSLGLCLGAAAAAIFPNLLRDAALAKMFVRLLAVGIPSVAVGMVVLHWLWAAAIEFAAWRHGLLRSWNSGLRLASYACGWDLITSPIGIALLLLLRGPRQLKHVLGCALRAPRPSVVAYLEQARGLSASERTRVLGFAAVLTMSLLLLGLSLLLTVLVLAYI